MRIRINIPEIAALREAVEKKFGTPARAPRHFTALSGSIEEVTKEYISETTLQRIWQYKAGYNSASVHTLNVMSMYLGFTDWEAFCKHLNDSNETESKIFDGESINIDDLKIGAKIRIAWRPDRECIIQYLGNIRFEALETHNSKLAKGDTFTCTQMQKGREMCLDNLVRGESDVTYVIGTKNGLTGLEILED